MDESAPRPLEYAPRPAWHGRRGARRAVIVSVLLLAGIVAVYLGYVLALRFRANWRFGQCMAHALPEGHAVYRFSPQEMYAVPRIWTEFYEDWSGGVLLSRGTLFLHERSGGAGARLVAVDLAPTRMWVTWRVFVPPVGPSSARGVKTGTSSLPLPTSGEVTIYAGQTDAADASHFTIAMSVSGQRMVVDGWLKADDSVVLEPREVTAPATSSPGLSP